jgi:hypothetical protein
MNYFVAGVTIFAQTNQLGTRSVPGKHNEFDPGIESNDHQTIDRTQFITRTNHIVLHSQLTTNTIHHVIVIVLCVCVSLVQVNPLHG